MGAERVGLDTDKGGAITDPRREARAASISAVVASIATVVVWVVAVIMILGELGVDLAPLIAATGIAGIALGFGAQTLVKDCITGLFMLIEDQYGIGDEVDLGTAVGTVERITLRTTVLRGPDGTVWHVPNGQVLRVGNRSQLWSVALLDVAIDVQADVERASEVLRDVADTRVRVDGLRRRRARTARSARGREHHRRRRHVAPARQDQAGQRSSGCSACCGRRSRRPWTRAGIALAQHAPGPA